MTISDVVQGIVDVLNSKFGSGFNFYTEQVNQFLSEPCFLVKCLDPAQNLSVGIRFWKTHQFSVQYFPSVQNSNSECYDVSEQLFECLSDISVGGSVLHGTNLLGQMTDGVLTFTVNYDVFVLQNNIPEESMGEFTAEVGTKEGE